MSKTRPKVAAITTVWRKDSHADVIVSKLLAGYDLDGSPVAPSVDVLSLYADQVPEKDLSRRWCARFKVPIAETVADALTLSTGTLGVDAALIVGEHGEYPWNERGQHLYPRRELFERAVEVIRAAGRGVPIFVDKHFSYSWDNALWMYRAAQEIGAPLMAGSSLPVTYRSPDLEIPWGAAIDEALVLSHGPAESYGFHALETLQCMVERRAGGETGVVAVETLHGDAFWAAWRAGRFPAALYEAALGTIPERRTESLEDFYAQQAAPTTSTPGPQSPLAFVVSYRDGLRAYLLNLSGYVNEFAFAARLASSAAGQPSRIDASCFVLERQPPRWHFNFLVHHIEQFFLTGVPPYPVERTLLTTGMLAALMDSAFLGKPVETQHLAISYQSPRVPWRRAQGRSLPPARVWGFEPEDV